MNQSFFIFGGLILIWGLSNVIIYFYLKYTHKVFFNYIKNREYIIFKNIETETEFYSKLGAKISYRKSDIIFLNDEIFILTFNKAIIQLSKNLEVFPGVMHKFTYDSKLRVNDRLEIKKDNNLKVNLNFKNKNFDFEKYQNKL